MNKESKGLLLVSSVIVIFALSSQSALADIKVRGGVASTNFALGYINVFNSASVDNTFLTTSLGATFISDDGLYLDVSGSRGSIPGSITRSDSAIYFGNSGVNDSGRGFNYYIGYKTGETVLKAPALTNTEDTYTTSGVIVGGGFNWPLDMGGAFGLNAATGLGMSSTWKDDASYSAKATGVGGFSVGASYTYPFSPTYGIAVDLKSNVYTYTFNSCKGSLAATCQYKEDSRSVGANLYYQF